MTDEITLYEFENGRKVIATNDYSVNQTIKRKTTVATERLSEVFENQAPDDLPKNAGKRSDAVASPLQYSVFLTIDENENVVFDDTTELPGPPK